MSSDFLPSATRRFLITFGVLAAAGLLQACQVRPLYEEQGNAATSLPSISFSDASDRLTQQLRNRLIFLVGGGAGEPAQPEYRVKLQVSASASEVLSDKASTTMKTGNYVVTASN